jgi:hypothetical protein
MAKEDILGTLHNDSRPICSYSEVLRHLNNDKEGVGSMTLDMFF